MCTATRATATTSTTNTKLSRTHTHIARQAGRQARDQHILVAGIAKGVVVHHVEIVESEVGSTFKQRVLEHGGHAQVEEAVEQVVEVAECGRVVVVWTQRAERVWETICVRGQETCCWCVGCCGGGIVE